MRLLIVAYFFPPAGGGGVQRVLKLAKYLPEYGVEVHVLTPDDPQWDDTDAALPIPPGTMVHRARYRGPKQGKPKDLLAGLRGVRWLGRKLLLQPRRVMVPDPYAMWYPSAVREGVRVARQNQIDVVLSTSPPTTDHLVGRTIARRCDLPWIVDLRDSWLNEPGLRLSSRLVRAKLAVSRRLSDRTVGIADRVLTVSQPLVDELATRYPAQDALGRIHLLMNGVDPEDFEDLPSLPPNDRFTLLYTGNFFGARSPRPLLDAVRELVRQRPELAQHLRVRFVGSLKPADHAWIAADPALAQVVEIAPFQPYRQSLAEQRSADLLLLAIAEGDRHAGEITGKLFEYVAARRPILAVVPPDGAASDVLRAVDQGVDIVAPSDSAGIVAALTARIDTWLENGRSTELLPWNDRIDALVSRRGRAQQLAVILHELVPEAPSPDPA